MFWDNRSARFTAAVALGVFALPATAMAGIVVSASGPSAGQYPPGKKLDDAARVTLKAGDSVTVIDAKGTRVLRGPGTIALNTAGRPSQASTFATLTKRNADGRVRTGAVREGSDAAGKVINPSLWNVDASRSGTMCLADPGYVQVWRPEWKSDATYTVAALDGSAKSTVGFKVKETVGDWDVGKTPIAEGKTYAISAPGEAMPQQVTFALLPQVPQSPEDLATALIEKGCTTQLELLAETLTPTKK